MLIIDAHVHTFKQLNGKNLHGTTTSGKYGNADYSGKLFNFTLPDNVNTAFTIDIYKEYMQRHGVDKAVLFQNPTIGSVNDYYLDILNEHPDTFAAVMQVDPKSPDAFGQIETLSKCKGFKALKFEMSEDWGWCGIHKDLTYDDYDFRKVVDCALNHDLIIVIDTGEPGNVGHDTDGLERLMNDFDKGTFQFEHLWYPAKDESNTQHTEMWQAKLEFAKRDNVYLGYSSIAVNLGEEYPCKQSNKLLLQAVKTIGAHKLLWGTDVAFTLQHMTYKQMIDSVLLHATELSESDKEYIMGKTANNLYFS